MKMPELWPLAILQSLLSDCMCEYTFPTATHWVLIICQSLKLLSLSLCWGYNALPSKFVL